MTDLQEAFREAARREFAMVPDEDELDYTFSSGFQRKMRRIIRAQIYGYWQFVNTTAKRITCVAAIIVMLLTTAMAIKPVRERVIKFFVEVYEDYFSVTFGEEKRGDLYSTPVPITRYTLSWFPEEYVETEYTESDVLLTTVWMDNEKCIMLNQSVGTHETTLDHIAEKIEEFEYKDLIIRHLTLSQSNAFVWDKYGYIFQLLVPDDLPLDVALQMIDSLIVEKNN